MVGALIFGMGLPTMIAYLLCASIVTSALVTLGIPMLVAHLFVFYFACISGITPPVAMAAYTGAGIAGANLNKTALTAMRYGVVGFIVPYMFVFSPALLMKGNTFDIITSVVVSAIGIVSFVSATNGWLGGKLNYLERGLLFISALFMILFLIWGNILLALAGSGLLVLIFIVARLRMKGESREI